MLAVHESMRLGRNATPESSAVRAHSKAAFWAFDDAWEKLFRNGEVINSIKETLPGLRVAFGEVRILRQPTERGGARSRSLRGKARRTDQL